MSEILTRTSDTFNFPTVLSGTYVIRPDIRAETGETT
jgi:hypothetical protein